jgi:hypothetical protein
MASSVKLWKFQIKSNKAVEPPISREVSIVGIAKMNQN